jgi:hypothetical protein
MLRKVDPSREVSFISKVPAVSTLISEYPEPVTDDHEIIALKLEIIIPA